MRFSLLYRDAEDKINFRFISSHLIWSQPGHPNLMILYVQTGWQVEASGRCHGVGLDASLSISDCPGRDLLPIMTVLTSQILL